jgi:hypothetical protein
MLQRPIDRIDRVLSRLKRLWHYYPVYSLPELVLRTAIYANQAESDLPSASMEEIEDIAYPEGHLLHGTRDLEMGIDGLEKFHENEPLPPVPIQTAILGRFADYWRRHPQERLGQLLMNDHHMGELDQQLVANRN